ncbi:MAG: NAD(P)/FAD-dependent oxidoreductase [Henriciella sp.]
MSQASRPDRRAFLKLSAAAASLASCAPRSGSKPKSVAVIGGGIIGASIAYHLAQQGAQVTLLERGKLAERASRGTFAWINATWAKQPRHYHAFNQAGLAGWKRLQADLDIPVRWGGSLEWFPSADRQARLAEQIAEQVEWGEPARMISTRRFAELEPNVEIGETDQIAFSPNDGAVDPVLATHILAASARAAGATVQEACEVETVFDTANGRAQLKTNCGSLVVDDFVLATGAAPRVTQALAGIDIPQRSTPGVIVVTKPVSERLVNRIIVAPGVHIHQRDDGRIVLGEQDGAPETAAHAERLRNRPNRFPDPVFAVQHAARILDLAEQFVPGISSAEIEDVFIGWRPLPIDGHPVIGRSPRRGCAYLAIMHSGVSLAPIVGELVAKEIVTGRSAPEIEMYRADRSFESVRRY